jgi:hypothetical protein
MDWKADELTNRKGTPATRAIAFAMYVFPVPGGPSKRIARRGVPPISSLNVLCARKRLSVLMTSSTTTGVPLTSSSETSISLER